MSSMPAATLIIAAYKRADVLDLVLTSVAQQTFQDVGIVVADDGSGPDVRETITRWQRHFMHPVVHEWHEDSGFRKTLIVNRAMVRARSPYLIFIDADCILHHRFLEHHMRRRAPRQVLSGRRVMMDAHLTARVTAEDIRSRRIERVGYWWKHAGQHDRKNGFYLPWMFALRARRANYQILGCNFSVHREDILSVNGYDERIIGRGLEDVNLWARLNNAGMATRSVTFEALQYHCAHGSDPMPHDPAFIDTYARTTSTWTPFGAIKSESPQATDPSPPAS